MDAFIGEIRAFTWPWVPYGWLACDGSIQSFQQYQVLGVVLGKTYGGDGQTNFGLPNIQGQVLTGSGQLSLNGNPAGLNYPFGGKGGSDAVTLNYSQLPPHTHTFNGVSNSTIATVYSNATTAPANGSFLTTGFESTPANPHAGMQAYNKLPPDTSLAANTLVAVGGTTPHENRQPFLVLSYCICWEGIYPSQS
jgi:microcystin-dependent protein